MKNVKYKLTAHKAIINTKHTIVYESVSFEGVGLSEAHVAQVTLVRFLPGVGALMALQLESVWGRICAVCALKTYKLVTRSFKLYLMLP